MTKANYDSLKGESSFSQSFNVELLNPCKVENKLIPSFENLSLHALLGQGTREYEYMDFTDDASMAFDAEMDFNNQNEL